jgi:hypothetical protein
MSYLLKSTILKAVVVILTSSLLGAMEHAPLRLENRYVDKACTKAYSLYPTAQVQQAELICAKRGDQINSAEHVFLTELVRDDNNAALVDYMFTFPLLKSAYSRLLKRELLDHAVQYRCYMISTLLLQNKAWSTCSRSEFINSTLFANSESPSPFLQLFLKYDRSAEFLKECATQVFKLLSPLRQELDQSPNNIKFGQLKSNRLVRGTLNVKAFYDYSGDIREEDGVNLFIPNFNVLRLFVRIFRLI